MQQESSSSTHTESKEEESSSSEWLSENEDKSSKEQSSKKPSVISTKPKKPSNVEKSESSSESTPQLESESSLEESTTVPFENKIKLKKTNPKIKFKVAPKVNPKQDESSFEEKIENIEITRIEFFDKQTPPDIQSDESQLGNEEIKQPKKASESEEESVHNTEKEPVQNQITFANEDFSDNEEVSVTELNGDQTHQEDFIQKSSELLESGTNEPTNFEEPTLRFVSQPKEDYQSKIQAVQTAIYLITNTDIFVRAATNAANITGLSLDSIIYHNSALIKGTKHVMHTGFSIAQFWYSYDTSFSIIKKTQSFTPLLNTAVFTARVYTDWLTSDNKVIQCGIDVATSTVSHLTMFNFLNAGIAAFLTVSRCATETLSENNKALGATLLHVIDMAHVINNVANTKSNIIKLVEVLKGSYVVYDIYHMYYGSAQQESTNEIKQEDHLLYKEIYSENDNIELVGQNNIIDDTHNEL